MSSRLLPKIRVKNDIKLIYLLFGIVVTYFSSYLPDFMYVAGVDYGRISSIVSFGTLNGMLFGPFWGAIVSLSALSLHELRTGTYLSKSMFSMLAPLLISLSSVVAGLVVNREYKAVKVIFFGLIFAWYLLDVGRTVFYYPWFHLLVLVAFVFFERSLLIKSLSRKYIFLSFLFAALMGVLSNHLAGSILYHILYGVSADMYASVAFVYPVERSILAFFPAFVMYVLFVVIKEILISSNGIEDELKEKKVNDVEDYLHNDVISILNKKK